MEVVGSEKHTESAKRKPAYLLGGSHNYWQEQFQEGIEINGDVNTDCQMYSKGS